MFALVQFGPHAPHRMNQTLHHSASANPQATSRQPGVTGAVALYASTHPGGLASEIRTALLSSVKPTASLSGKTVTGGRLDVGATERAGRIEIAIGDQGPGIPADVLKKLGQPFVTTRASGSGLGLFLARRLAESAGGGLTIDSAPGAGTVVRVRFPRARTRRPV